MKTGIIIMGSDERRQVVRNPLIRANLYRKAPTGHEYDYEPPKRLRDVIGVYLGFGRWNAWLYFRDRHLDGSTYATNGRWLTVVDIQREHELAEAASA